MYDRARLLEPLSDSDSSDSDTSDNDEEPIEEIASPGELPTPQAEGNEEAWDREPSSEDSGDDSSGHEDGSEEDMDEDASDSEDGSEEDMDEDASDSEDGSEEGEESAEEEVGPRRSARIAAQNANHAGILLLLRLRDSVQNMW